MRRSPLILGSMFLTLAAAARPAAGATRVTDLARIDGARTNVLTGMGLVIGLHGKGDGPSFLPAIKPLAQILARYNNGQDLTSLSASGGNVAIVLITATIPEHGTRNGATLDVRVSSIGAATDLRGGQLFTTPLLDVFGRPHKFRNPIDGSEYDGPCAMANGVVHVEDESTPTSGVVEGGAVMEADIIPKYVDDRGIFTLVLNDPTASFATAKAIEKMINEMADTGDRVAVAVDAKNVLVRIPIPERDHPADFIDQVLKLPVPVGPVEARVRINRKTGTMVITGDVEITPSVISHKGLTITTTVPAPNPAIPRAVTKQSVAVDTTGTGGARLQDLAATFDLLKVPIDDRIEIVKELYKLGQLHAKLTIDGQDQ